MFAYAKALVAFIVAGLGALQVAQLDDKVTSGEWTGVILAAFVALTAVFAVPNIPRKVP